MALLTIAIYDTEENKKTEHTIKTVDSILNNNQLRDQDRMILVDNNSCKATKDYLASINHPRVKVITLEENLGTARGINVGWQERRPGENAIKMDNDIVIDDNNWIFQLERALELDSNIGIAGLKRKDCIERPTRTDNYKSELKFLNPHGTPWVVAEIVFHVMGSCQMYSSELLDKIGYLYQIGLYGFDDVFAAVRCIKSGKVSAFLPHIEIHHIDPGQTNYQGWKEKVASQLWDQVREVIAQYNSGEKSVYQEFY
jgi:GT2 family glycosyltransferase